MTKKLSRAVTATPLGTRRRIRALGARGWTLGAIEEATGVPAADMDLALRRTDRCPAHLPEQVAGAYDRLWHARPPETTTAQQKAAEARRTHAGRLGWPPPMAYDDELMDLPEGKPEPGWRRTKENVYPRAALLEDVEFVREHDGYRQANITQVAMRLGIRRERLEKALARERDAELEAAG